MGAAFVTLGYVIAPVIGIPLMFLTPLSVTGRTGEMYCYMGNMRVYV